MVDFTKDLSPAARELLGIVEKEVTVPDKKTIAILDEMPEKAVQAPLVAQPCCQPGSIEMTVDSPKETWDAVGHVSFKFVVANLDEALEKVGNYVAFWAAVREDFADEFEKADAMSPAQASLLKRLLKVSELSKEDAALSKIDASAKIEELMKADKEKPVTGTGNSGGRFERRTSAPAPRAKDGGYKTGGPAASDATLSYAEKIAKRKGIQLPEDYQMWSQTEASGWIQDNK